MRTYEIPENLRAAYTRLALPPEDALLAIETDINVAGERDSQWLIATRSRVLVFEPGDELPIADIPLKEAESFRITAAVGSGLLQVKVEGIWLDLLRYSNRLRPRFSQAVRRLESLRKGDEVTETQDASDPSRCPDCRMMLESPGEPCPSCLDHGAAVSRVVRMIAPYWRSAAILFAFLLAGVGLDMAWPLLTRYLVDHVLTGDPGSVHAPVSFLQGSSARTALITVVACLASIHIVRAGVNLVTSRISGRVGNAMTHDIRIRLVKKLEELGLEFYSKQETGSLVGRVAYDTDAIQSFMSQVTSGFLMQFILVAVSFAMMFSLEPSLALWAMLPAPFVLSGAYLYWRYVHPRFQRLWDRNSKQAGLLNGILSGIRVVKAFGREDGEYDRFTQASRAVQGAKDALDRTGSCFYPLMAVVFQAGGWIIWYIGGRGVLDHRMSLGTLMAFFGYLGMFYGPLGSLTNLTTWLTQFSTQVHRIFEILDTPTALAEASIPVRPERASGEIEFRDVTFGYSPGYPVIKGLNLRARPGERIGIVGRSGSGKTSIINLLFRFYDVESGQILVDGVDVRQMSREDLRSRLSIVLQEAFLFKGSLAENIAYGNPSARPEEIIEAARAACAHDFLLQHPLGYDTSVGERGQELSGGERQRVSIARALLRRAPILVLDEATSAIDSESEMLIQSALDDRGSGRTMLIIAHRLSTLRSCDRIYVVEGGRIVEEGSHRALIAQDGRYAAWVRIQQGGATGGDEAHEPTVEEKSMPTESHRARWLNPGQDRLERGPRGDLRLHLEDGGEYRGVFALRCFPVHDPDRWISLRFVDSDGRVREAGIIRDLGDWSPSARALIQESLGRRYFFHTIEGIRSIRKVSQFLNIAARTDLGDVEFILRHAPESAQDYGKKGKLLLDVEDNLYLIPDVAGLRRADREVFERHVYW